MTGAARLRQMLANRAAALVATAVLTTVAAVLVTWPLAREMGSATLRDGEVLLTAWQLNWFQHALLADPRTWVDANIFFPYDRASTFNDLLLTHALVTLPAAWARSPVLALNFALLGGIVLCGVCAYLLSRRAGRLDRGRAWSARPSSRSRRFASCISGTCRSPRRGPSRSSSGRCSGTCGSRRGRARHSQVPRGVAVGLSSVYHAAFVAPIVPLVLLVGASTRTRWARRLAAAPGSGSAQPRSARRVSRAVRARRSARSESRPHPTI